MVLDPGGVQLEFRFADWRFDPPFGNRLSFALKCLRGVAIVDGDIVRSDSEPVWPRPLA